MSHLEQSSFLFLFLCQGQCTRQERWSSVKLTTKMEDQSSSHHICNAVRHNRLLYDSNCVWKIGLAPFLSSTNVPLDSDFPDPGTWFTDFHISAFCVIIYGLMLWKHWRKCIVLITSGDLKGIAPISSATRGPSYQPFDFLKKTHHPCERQWLYLKACRNSVQSLPLQYSHRVDEYAFYKERHCLSFV